jgi:hypothetical protein
MLRSLGIMQRERERGGEREGRRERGRGSARERERGSERARESARARARGVGGEGGGFTLQTKVRGPPLPPAFLVNL